MGCVGHPNAVVARRELERQERGRLRRLSEVRSTQASSQGSARRPSSRSGASSSQTPKSGRNSRPSSRPPSASGKRSPAAACPWARSDEHPGAPVPPQTQPPLIPQGGRRSRSEAAPRLHSSFLLCPQRRLEDARKALQVNSAEERRMLMEELQGWYFSTGARAAAEEAAAATRNKAARPFANSPYGAPLRLGEGTGRG
mmetsp:Transcript_6124/g.19252  ORF Transcript_6124/g.19252 Transcript_6124/m.19252 type:complete len:199 (-) Transcript_6124:49-645(-)